MRTSIRRIICLIITSCLSCLIIIETILEFSINMENQFEPTHSAGLMLNRSQMLLSKEILLQPSLFTCSSKINNRRNSFIKYPIYIIVKTRAASSGIYFQRRMFTRTSWAHEARLLGIPVIYAIGRAKDERIQKMLEYENTIYNDLLQFNFIDSYYNMSIKTTGILHWFLTYNCYKTTPYLFIVDDDILINISSLLEMISKQTFQFNTIYGLHLKNIEPHPTGKWAVSLKDYPNETYPEFITGASTLYPTIILDKILYELFDMINRNQSIFFLDDVLISGIIANKLNIQRASLFGIEDCSYTNLLSRTIISECNHNRRIYVWSKFILSRLGQNTVEIDRLIQTTTNYIKWIKDFKQTRNGTAIIPINFIQNSYLKFGFLLIFIIIFKIFSFRQSSFKPTSTILFTLDK